MIDFRYHLVSIIAVFLALAVGLAVGSTALTGKAEQALSLAQRNALSDNASLRKQQTELQQQVAADQAFATASSQRLLDGLLTGEQVVLVSAPGADGAVATGLTAALKQAGATVTGQVSLSASFTTTSGRNEATLSQLAQSLASAAGLTLTPPADDEDPGQQAAAQVLAASLLTSSSMLPAASAEAILSGLSQGGFVSVSSGTPADTPATLAILITPSSAQPQSTSDVMVAVARELKAASGAAVMAGPVTPAGTGNVITAENNAGNVISTVDNADTESGQIVVVQALRLLLDGKTPQAFGVAPGTAPSPAPTASETVPSGAKSSTVKSAKSGR